MGDRYEVRRHKAYLWFLEEMRRTVGHKAFDALRSDPEHRRALSGSPSTWIWKHIVDSSDQASVEASAVIADHASNLFHRIRAYRSGARDVDEYRPLKETMRKAQALAANEFKALGVRGGRVIRVRCGYGHPNVEKMVGRDVLVIGPMWDVRVHREGIATASHPSGKTACILSAKRKASAFLAEDGIRVFEAVAYVPAKRPLHEVGYVFAADGEFSVFHTDFRLGANLIRKRIRNAVLGKLLGD